MSRMFFIAIIVGVLVFSSVSLGYTGGSGTPDKPYQIATKADLLALAGTTEDYNKCFILTADIDMQGQVFTSAIIAPDTNPSSGFQGTAFTGVFDGNSQKITNFAVNGGSNWWYLGLFGYIGSSIGKVKNLGLESCIVRGSSPDSLFVGGLVGRNDGSISNCYSIGAVSGDYYVGRLVGYNYGNITNCHSAGSVSGASNVGGLVGENEEIISNCYSTGAVSGTSSIGGLVGRNEYGSIINCYSRSAVSSSFNFNIGGLVGSSSGGSISSCYFLVTSGPDNDYGEPLTDEKMKQQVSFIGWDFTTPVWTIEENEDYPRLWWEKEIAKLFVPSVYPIIQDAIDAAVDGNTVIVAPGTYTGPGNRDIDFKGKAITVCSINPDDPNIVAATIIDCQGTSSSPHRGFYFHNGEDADSVLNGFTVKNGYSTYGGGISCESSSPTITDCTIISNSAYEGGGMSCRQYSSPIITNCEITGNSAEEEGGGIYCRDYIYESNPIIINCTITGNSASYYGGGIHGSGGPITNCTITGNSAEYLGGGGLAWCYH